MKAKTSNKVMLVGVVPSACVAPWMPPSTFLHVTHTTHHTNRPPVSEALQCHDQSAMTKQTHTHTRTQPKGPGGGMKLGLKRETGGRRSMRSGQCCVSVIQCVCVSQSVGRSGSHASVCALRGVLDGVGGNASQPKRHTQGHTPNSKQPPRLMPGIAAPTHTTQQQPSIPAPSASCASCAGKPE